MPISVKVEVGVPSESYKDVGDRLLRDAKQQALDTAEATLRAEQDAGRFPKDEADYTLRLYNRGRWSTRKFETIQPYWLRLPFTLRWINDTGDNLQAVIAAVKFAQTQLLRRAPFRTGRYTRSISIIVNGTVVPLSALRVENLSRLDFISVGPTAIYASTLERGFAQNAYDTENIAGGIVRPVARMIRKHPEFAGQVAARFAYELPTASTSTHRGGTDRQASQYYLPVIQIGVADAFLENDARIRKSRRRR